jgi:2-amino-4-hydroxy-6-hydroxymethyldihydropteridine diphosphokinase
MNTVIISIGSNIDADTNIPAMLEILGSETHITGLSDMVKTSPIGIKDQPDYTNGAVKVETLLSPEKLDMLLKSVEDRMGRDRTLPKFGPRIIDLDIVAWNGEIVDPDYYTRDFLKKAVDSLL